MFSHLLVALLAIYAQANDPAIEARVVSDASLSEVRVLEGDRTKLSSEKRGLEQRYKEQLAEVERLRRQRASWNRDRKLRETRAEAQVTAARLKELEQSARTTDGKLHRARDTAVAAIDREISLGASGARRQSLQRERDRVASANQAAPRPIKLPDAEIDQLADPDELLEQAALIKRAEAQLSREYKQLEQREQNYRRVAKLAGKRDRDREFDIMAGDDVRHPGTSNGSRDGVSASSANQGPQAGSTPTDTQVSNPAPAESGTTSAALGTAEDASFGTSAVVLTGVIDEGTVDALRRAQTSDAGTRVRAAERARSEVGTQLDRLRARRAAIEERAEKLRRRR